jgi:type VI secretion system secreted protein VgrG
MSSDSIVLENRPITMAGSYKAQDLMLKCALVEEGLSTITRATVEFLSKDRSLDLKSVVGYTMNVSITTAQDTQRKFLGTCVSAEFLGVYQGFGHFTAEVRPWLWFLTLRHDNRIFQELSVVDIIKKVFSEAQFSDYEVKATGTYKVRTYCVQYRESDFAFISRLMEEEGLYYFFTHDGEREKLVIADGIGAHQAAPGGPRFDFFFREEKYRRSTDHIYEWSAAEAVTPGKVALTDWNFETPSTDLKKIKSMPKGDHSHTGLEIYDYPGNYRTPDIGEDFARTAMEAQAAQHQRWTGVGNIRTLGVGQTFQLKGHPRTQDAAEFLLTRATHYVQIEREFEERDTGMLSARAMRFDHNDEAYRVVFDAIPKSVQYRAPKLTPWPSVSGLHTAIVVGPSGEEIHTDKYGRIKVKFHWDRTTPKDDTVSCWVRTVMPWTGKNWGMIAIPRIGQEVVIQFEEGNPDRPICTGMLYKADTMPPYELPANKTISGVKTRSTKEGGETNYNELVFEDKKGGEYIRFHAEKNYWQTVENDAVIRIGLDKKDKGDLTQTIHRHKTETLKTGDMTFTVEQGNETRSIAVDQTETIGSNRTTDVGADDALTVGGNSTEDIGGTRAETVGSSKTVDIGTSLAENIGTSMEVKAGTTVLIDAGAKLTLKVGGSSIEMTPAGITMKSPKITITGDLNTEVKGGLMLVLKGGMTMIN